MEAETLLIHLSGHEGTYQREFTARVLRTTPDGTVLDRTAFYPEGGGQPGDTGRIEFELRSVEVTDVRKRGGTVLHLLRGESPASGSEVRGVIDWERRYAHMRMHTAQHLLSGVAFDRWGARTVGCQIHSDRSRIDMSPPAPSPEALDALVDELNRLIARAIGVKIYEVARSEVVSLVKPGRALIERLPPAIERLRVVAIGDMDICPCGGTHVRNISELGSIRITGRESKGAGKERLTMVLGS